MSVTAMRPREAVATRLIGVDPAVRSSELYELAKLRMSHPGGVGQVEATRWAGAYDGLRLVAAVGWIEEKPGMWMVVEVDKTDDHWGKIGVIVLIRQLIEASEKYGFRLQALILPGNVKLKAALEREGAKIAVEIWEKFKEPT